MKTALLYPIFIAAVMPYVFTLIAKVGAFGNKQNHRTRDWQQELTGWRKRAHWAHQNSFEAFPLFAIMCLIAHLHIPDNDTALIIAWTFIGLRVVYGICFIADWAKARSLVWFAALACPAALFFLSIAEAS